MPLRLRASSPAPDRKIYIGSIEVQTLDGSTGTGRRRTIQPIGSLMPSFTAGYLELPSSSGGSITSDQGAGWFQSSYTLTVASNQYIKIMIALSNQGKVVLTFGAPGASEAATTMPIALSGSLPIGYITAYNSSGTIQSVSDLNIRQFTSGGGGGGAGASSKQVTLAAHGFVPGDVLYLNGSTYAKAQADVVATSEVVGIVSNVFASDLFELTEIGYISNTSFTISGGGTMTAGEVYFLSPSNPGKLTASEPTNVGHVSKPMMIADGPTSGYVLNYRGSIVGGVNARSQVVLANNNSTPIQYVAPYDAGEIVGWVSLTNTTVSNSKKFYIQIQFAKNGPGTDYNVAYQVSGDTPPAGFAVSYSSNYIRITLPNISNLISASINFALNAPAVGTSFPLNISGNNVTGGTPLVNQVNESTINNGVQIQGRKSGIAIPIGYIGERIPSIGLVDPGNVGVVTNASVTGSLTLQAGIYQIIYGGVFAQYGNHNSTSDYFRGGSITVKLYNGTTDIDQLAQTVVVPYTPSAGGNRSSYNSAVYVNLNAQTIYSLRYTTTMDGNTTMSTRNIASLQLYAIRIA
jgi:hypothetical protein